MPDNRIEVVIDTRDNSAAAELAKLRQSIDSVRAAQENLRRSTFDAFSRAQIQPQITALDELAGKVRKVVTEMQVLGQMTGATASTQQLINNITGADRAIISASRSAGTLATSLSAAAEADNRVRQGLDQVAGSANRAAMAYELMLSKSRAMATVQGTQFLAPTAMAGPAKWIEEQRGYEKEVSRSFGAINSFIDDSARKQQAAARQGFEAAAREVERTRSLRQRELEAQGDAAIKAATARDEAARRVQIQDVYRSYATGEYLPGSVRSAQAKFFSPEDIATAQSLTARMDLFRQSGERTNGILRLNRIGFLELQAAGVNTVQALASGMSVVHVAIMESAQVLGALVQGGFVPLVNLVTHIKTALGSGLPLFTPIQAGIAGAVAATAALAAGMGMVAYRAYQAESAISGLHNRMLLQGRDAPQVARNVDAMMNSMMARGGLSRDEARGGAIAVQVIPNISANARQIISESFEALTRTQFGGDFEKATEAVNKIFSSTSSMRSFVEENNALTGGLREQFEAAIAAGDGFRASELAAQALSESMSKTNQVLKETRDSFWQINTIDLFGRSIAPNSAAFDARLRERLRTGGFEQLRFPGGREGPSPQEILADRSIEQHLQTEREINALLRQRENLLERIKSTVDATRRETLSQTVREIDRSLGEKISPVDQEAHRLRMANLERELQQTELAAAKNPALWARAAEIRKQLEDEVARHTQGALGRIADATQRVTAEMIAAAQRTADARRKIAEEALGQQLFESNFRAAQSPTDVYRQLAEARTRLAAVEAAPRDVGSAEQIRSIQIEILGLQRQITDHEQQSNSARLQQAEVLAQGRQDLAAIVDLRRQEAALIAGNKFSTDTQRTQAQTAIIQAQIQAQQRAVQLTMQTTEAANQFANSRMQTSIAALNLEASQYNITKEQAIQSEMQLTASVMAQSQQRLRELLATQGLTVDQKAQINNQLADLYEQDAQKQIELQSRLTEAIRAENEKRTQNFKNFFQTVETGLSDVLVAGVLKTQTRTQALRGLGSSIVTSFIKEAASMGSQFAGKSLADAMGIKVDPSGDTSISSVLAKGLGQALGLTKDVPKVDQAAIADKMKLASDTQKTAADLMLEAAKGMQQAAQAGPYRGGAGQAEGLRAGTQIAPITPYRPSADSNFGSVGEYGVGQPSTVSSASNKDVWFGAKILPKAFEPFKDLETDAPTSGPGYPTTVVRPDVSNIPPPRGGDPEWVGRLINIEPLSNNTAELSSKMQADTAATQELTSTMRQASSGSTGSWSPMSEGSNQSAQRTTTSASNTNTSLSNLSSVIGITTGALALFGGGLSSEGRKVVGAITLMISAMQLFSSMSAVSGAGSALSGVTSVLKLIPFVGGLFEHGGIVPSAAGGMVMDSRGGQLGIVHPREMVLPARLSDGIQSMIERGGGISNDNRANTVNNSPVLNYSANVTGYHPYSSKSSFEGLLRQHGGALMAHVENAVRNGWRG